MHSQPEILQQIFGLKSVPHLCQKKLENLGTQTGDQRGRSFPVRVLVTAHERFHFARRPFTQWHNL
jgi:hypothetical protein